jgi:hypothetical protein
LGTREITQDNVPDVNLSIAPEVLEIQVDAPDMGQATMWKWTWEQSTLPYARRTITNSNELNVPLYKEGTYVVNNFAAYDIHGSMTQTHSLYLKWVDGAGTDNLVSWATSAGPISDTHPDINGGNATDVQRITVNVPSTITLPSLTNPAVSYSVVNNGNGGYTFSGSAKGDNPNLGPFYRGGTYTININATGHPFYFTTDNGTNFSSGSYFGEYTSGVTGSRTDSGTITFTVPAGAPDTLYYQCGNHGVMRGEITVKDLAVETNINGNYVVYFQHTQEGHKTAVELRPIPSLVNQMCLVYDSTSGKFVPQDLATYVENTPSFENKIREVAGTAELVVEDGSAVIAKVNVYDDSTYLPLTGNNPGDQAFATDTDILYIWDGSAWQQAGAANSDDLTEGSTNLFFTDARVSSYLSSNDFDTATNIVASITDSAPATLDTLNELAAALGDDPNFATTTANNIATKLAITDFTSTADTWIGTKDTGALSEGSNLYYTNTRVDARIALQAGSNLDLSGKSTSDLSEGTNLYYTDARADARITASDTDALSEGSTNLYYTDARVKSSTITGGSLRGTVNNTTVQYATSYSGTPAQGSFFFDSLNQKLKVYTGSVFVDAVPASGGGGGGGDETDANATFRKYTYSITSSTNAISGADDNTETLSYTTTGQNVEVYRNGVKQVEGASNDYVATTGSSVNFTYNLSSGDVVDVQVYELLTNDAYYLKTETYTQAEVNSQISTGLSGLVDSAPTTLDTLNELAAALGDDANFSTTVTNSIADKLPLAGGTMTGTLNVDVADLFVKDTTGGALGQVQIGAGTAQGFINIQKGDGTRNVQLFSDGDSYLNGGNVGIGTDNPTSRLHLKAPTNQTIQMKLQPGSDTAESEIAFVNAASNATKGYIKYKHSSDEIGFRTNGTEWVTINNIGDVNFNSNAKIQANGVVRYGNNSTGIGALSYGNNLITMEALSTNTSVRLTPSGTGIAEVFSSQLSVKDDNVGGTVLRLWNTDTGGKNWSLYSTASGNGEGAGHFLWNNGTSVPMIIQGGGNVGIGTIDPNTKLEISSLYGTTLRLSSTRNSNAWTPGQSIGQIQMYSADGTAPTASVRASIDAVVENASGNEVDLVFRTYNNTERLRITSDGKVKPGEFVLPVATTAPSSPVVGQQYYNSNSGAVLTYDGTVWKSSTGGVVASGGTESTYTAGGLSYKSHTFTSSGTFVVEGQGDIDIMIVAGGAAGGGHGGNDGSGGGGAGGMVVQTGVSAAPGTYNVIIGAGGGATGGATRGNNGSNSSVSLSGAITAIGGGGGGSETSGARIGKDGGSGGGAGGYGVKAGGLGTNGQGNNGGPCTGPGDGGGGGKGAAGNSGTTGTGGAGSGNAFRTGSNIDYAGGGGGSGDQRNSRGSGGGAGGSGGGGAGSNATSGSTPGNGSVNTGGGGGGAAGQNYAGATVSGSGGSGIVVIRYAL